MITVSRLADVVEGTLLCNDCRQKEILNLIVDSRLIYDAERSVFFALETKKNDGHKYIYSAYSKGVRVFVVTKVPDVYDFSQSAFILVDNSLIALQRLAVYRRSQFANRVVGITGSNGKTVVKEWIYQLLRSELSISKSPKSFNSQIGVPLSIWSLDLEADMGIFEAGISLPGEMAALQKIIKPHIGIFTVLGDAHQRNFDSYQQKLDEKLKLFEEADQLIYCCDNPLVNDRMEVISQYRNIELFKWSIQNTNADLYVDLIKKTPDGTAICGTCKEHKYAISIPFTDDASIHNCCSVLAFLIVTGNDNELILDRFGILEAVAMRMEINKGLNNCIVINDAYNSDIFSLEIALDMLEMQASKGFLSKTLVLSDILQSGQNDDELYAEVARIIDQKKIDKLIGIGSKMTQHRGLFQCYTETYRSSEQFLQQAKINEFKNEAILLKGARDYRFETIYNLFQEKKHQTALEIDLTALIHNLNVFRSRLDQGTKIMVMVKAFSYGGGVAEIARALQYHGVDYLAVAIADEGIELRKLGIRTPVVVMNPEAYSYQDMIENNLEPSIYSLLELKEFTTVLQRNSVQNYPVHLKVDTGMNRLGFASKENILEAINWLKDRMQVKVDSIFSHLAASDEPDKDEFTLQQIETFTNIAGEVEQVFPYPIMKHILNSAGIERFPKYHFDMVRLGIGLYGISALKNKEIFKTEGYELQNVSTLKTTISQIKDVSETATVGYGRKGVLERNSSIAVLPIGYADGLNRHLGCGVGSVLVGRKKVPFVGNICMDMCMIDVTNINAKVGDEVIIFGENHPITTMADKLGTIPYEILTSVSQRVKRKYFQE